MRARWKLISGLILAGAALAGSVALAMGWRPLAAIGLGSWSAGSTVRIGLIHSQTGYLAISEKSLLDAEIMAIEEINAAGGVNGRRVAWSSPDCRSDPEAFVAQARDLIEKEHAQALFGTWTSECRKAVQPVVAEKGNLLFFPGNTEGVERAERIIYVGGSANQSVLPAVRWAYDNLKARRFFVIGLEEVWSRTCCEISKDAIKCAGGELVGESFMPMLSPNIDGAIEAMRRCKPDVVLNFLVGDSNLAFYSAYRRAGFTAEHTPAIAFGFSEDESRRFVNADIAGQYAAWNYFQSIDRPENLEFVRKFRKRFGESRLIGDSMVAAYNSIHFWARAAIEVGSVSPSAVLGGLARQSRNAPDGIVTIDPATSIAWRPFHIARIQPDGQFVVIWSILKPIRPMSFVGTRSALDWIAFEADLKARWRGRWAAPADSAASGSAAEASPTPPGPAR